MTNTTKLDGSANNPRSHKTFDPNLIYCCVRARLDLGEHPRQIFDELKVCQVIDIDALRAVLDALEPLGITERPQDRRTGLGAYQSLPKPPPIAGGP